MEHIADLANHGADSGFPGHTPGPWHANGTQIIGPSGKRDQYVADVARDVGAEAALANARLIAAAPELLAACVRLERELNAWHTWRGETVANYRGSDGAAECGEIIGQARAAIARAEGRQP